MTLAVTATTSTSFTRNCYANAKFDAGLLRFEECEVEAVDVSFCGVLFADDVKEVDAPDAAGDGGVGLCLAGGGGDDGFEDWQSKSDSRRG